MGLDGCRNKLDVLLKILKTLYTCIILHNLSQYDPGLSLESYIPVIS